MSKQPHEQEEQKASDGAQSATSGDEASRGNGSGKRRSRRHDKSNQAGGTRSEAAKPAASQAPAEQPASSKTAGSKPEAGKPADKKPAAGKNETASTRTGKPESGGGGAKTGTPTATGSGGGKGGKAGVVAIVLVLLLAIAAALFGWQAWQKLDAQQARLAELESRTSQAATTGDLNQLQSRFEEAESERQASLEEAVSSLEGKFSDYRGEVNETLDRVLAELSSEQQTDERDWLHAEAAYLLRLANQRLQLERDVQGAAALLRTADARLKEADNPALVPVRREIANELSGLEAVPQVDRTGLWLTLNAQQEQIAGRPLSQDIDEITASSGMEEAPTGSWQQQLSSFGQELKSLVTVRKHDEALEALISPEQETYLRQSVRLVIEQAQLALLKEDETLFEASLDKAITLIEGYYDTDDSGVQSVLARLRELKGKAVRPELPDISGSQQALATFIERRFESRQGDEA
ncbi:MULTISPECIES: uroporphyrinogen-III C-methyltransferase [unclassified Halomonas]|uniref:uroporphyrinogen-III C-methyltransferase n=1 Tax=unclassified Halomonas TaxID=2609666 RepID=UPI002887288E|nr:MULTISPECIES: uroporphyrinogen-III C-methyltransferase [unclassified Halomonas]MDT0502710.1 uroporphyrinogen-III C-methyltransferase [Halomonas sp. PAR7]MDT0512559.1 uroporphyrinogen-III C-methyltransferase [Halomonas sp. LES1]MDT0592859.1 uroporphyrinogen-III C-methyltransferase [Halomonas sp. PAR8]